MRLVERGGKTSGKLKGLFVENETLEQYAESYFLFTLNL